MAYFGEFFRSSLEDLEGRKQSDSRISDALEKYEGRCLRLVINRDAEYVFRIEGGKVLYQENPSEVPDDIYVEMDFDRAKRIIEEGRFSPFDLFFVKYRNVKAEDIELVRTLLQS